MARWKLNAKHYIYAEIDGEPTQWEYEETARATGRKKRLRFVVPLLIDPDDPTCLNRAGECVVAFADTDHPGDIIVPQDNFHPTPEMKPLDAAAREISKAHEDSWIHPIESLPASGDYGAALIAMMEKQMLQINKGPAAPQSMETVSKAHFDALKAQLEQLMGMVAAGPRPSTDDEGPFEEIEPTPEELAVPPQSRPERRV